MDFGRCYPYVTSMASLTRKPRSKFWFACFRDASRKQRRKSTQETNYKKAMKIAEQYEQVAQRKLPVRAVRETIVALAREAYGDVLPAATTRSFAEGWLKAKKLEIGARTLVFYAKGVNKLIEFLGPAAEMDICTVTRTTIVEFRNWLAQRNSANTTNSDIRTVKAVFRAAKRDGYILENPTEFVELVKSESRERRRPFSVPEIQRVLEIADEEWRSLILFGFYSGQRLGDLVSLTWDNIDLQRNEIRLQTRKTGKRVMIPIASPLRAHIDALPVTDDPGKPLHPRAFAIMKRTGALSTVSNQFGDLLAAAGLRAKVLHRRTGKGQEGRRRTLNLSFHSLRVSAVSLLKDAGVPQAVVQELIGHESEAMSAIYTRVGRDALEKAAAAFPKL
jgi:integrase